ncbi:hypothetical protein F2P45_12870 [Massilia sp. CCM 8733]|uniref:Uncharacterized protein n=2 Tax=Massilia mucilaginosa TaxID=2609282 RepID=A0ABX0NT06_9BURK|nr:hypothetical protein [Massilia mucilaginosa]
MGAAGRDWRPSRGRVAIALLLAIAASVALAMLWMPAGPPAGHAGLAATSAPATAMVPPPAALPGKPGQIARAQARPDPEVDADPTPDLRNYVARGDNPSMAEVITRLHERGIHSGLGAFSPPGTSPPLAGLAVPEDFVLPKGYVRHHQATDDGQRIEAVLMFAPDFQLLDASGKPVEMPRNLVVPPELAPPGLPIRRIVIPPASTGR